MQIAFVLSGQRTINLSENSALLSITSVKVIIEMRNEYAARFA
jgi:hypothetical protein